MYVETTYVSGNTIYICIYYQDKNFNILYIIFPSSCCFFLTL